MNKNFKIGDRVRIRTFDEIVKEYGYSLGGNAQSYLTVFVEAMKPLSGANATIKHIYEDGGIKLTDWNIDTDKYDVAWGFDIGMIERVETDLDKVKYVINNILYFDWNFKTNSEGNIVLIDDYGVEIVCFNKNGKVID